MKKVLITTVIASLMAGCGMSKSRTLVQSEKKMAGKYQKIGEASFWGCITVIRGEAEKRQDPMMMLIGQNYCVSVAKQVIEQTLNSGPCSENDRECHFLSGCVKAKVALSESSILTTSKKQEAELARSCDTAFVLYQEAEEKDKAVKNGE